jgi:FtsH-binding integral membrane protein
MSKMGHGSIFTGFGVALILTGLGFVFFSSFHIEPTSPAANILLVIGHYLEGIVIGAVFVSVGVLVAVFGLKNTQKPLRETN